MLRYLVPSTPSGFAFLLCFVSALGCGTDLDGDGLIGSDDNCPALSNADQADLDADGVGDACDPDQDGDGAFLGGDCDDRDAGYSEARAYYEDADGDGRGDPERAIWACAPPPGYVPNADDVDPGCADDDGDVCGVCGGPGPQVWHPDVDDDGLGDASVALSACVEPPGWVSNGDDPEPGCATNDTDSCGVCGGADADQDCVGVCFGEAYDDSCGRCVGGTTGREPATGDADGDEIPDICDGCAGRENRRFVIQWTEVPHYSGGGGPYTFQVILVENGDVFFQYRDIEPYRASATIGYQDITRREFLELGYESDFAREHSTVWFERTVDAHLEASYVRPMEWLDIRYTGTQLELGDDASEEVPLGFTFPLGHTGAYTDATISSNGWVSFAGPLPGHVNQHIPDFDVGAFLAPLWDDLNPARGGTVHVQALDAGCERDCSGMFGGVAAFDSCGDCYGGDTGDVADLGADCAEVCGGTAEMDVCGVCAGGTTGVTPSAPEDCPSGPDLITDEDYLAATVRLDTVNVPEASCLVSERCVTGTGDRRVVRFGTRIANVGNEDLRLGRPGDGVSYWHWDACHGHFHYRAYAAYDLYDVAAGSILPIGSKNGFCVMDTGVYDAAIATAGCHGYGCSDQGITAGCQDTYGASLQCQWIDITGVASGTYEIIVTTNPDREITELNYENNSSRVRIELTDTEVRVIPRPPAP